MHTSDITEMKVVGLPVDIEALRAEVDASCRDVPIEMSLASVVGEQRQEAGLADLGVADDDDFELLRRTHLESQFFSRPPKPLFKVSFQNPDCCRFLID